MRFLADRYRLIEVVGAGGMSVVWRAFDEVLGRPVAVKLLAPKLAADPASADRIRSEARIAARLAHPHITAVHDYGESAVDGDHRPVPFVVMEFVEGESLDSRLAGGPLPWPVAAAVCAQVASALAAVHARGLVHRDIKPANVMLTVNGAKVVDFGISAIAGDHADAERDKLLGTPAYIAPERLEGAPTAPATDVYALGLLLYKSLAGHLPWDADTVTQMLTAHCAVDPAPLPRIDKLPAKVADLCARCLAKAPAKRPSAEEVARVLSSVAFAPLRTDRPRRRARLAVAGVSVAAMAVSLAVLGDRDPSRPATPLAAGADEAASARLEPAAQPQVGCLVRYTTTDQRNGSFDADLEITNTGAAPVEGWQLTFQVDSGQALGRPSAGTLNQDSDQVVVNDLDRPNIGPGDSVQVGLSGTYTSINPMPTGFALNGSACQQVLLAKTAPPPVVNSNSGRGDDEHGGKGKGKGKGKNSDED